MAISHNPNHTICHFLAFFYVLPRRDLSIAPVIIALLPPFHSHYRHHCSYTSLLTTHQKQASFSGGSDGKEPACIAGDSGLIPWLGRSIGEGNGNPLQYSCLENSMDRGAWWATVYGVAKSQTRLSD